LRPAFHDAEIHSLADEVDLRFCVEGLRWTRKTGQVAKRDSCP
jgi:hypothetical protein